RTNLVLPMGLPHRCHDNAMRAVYQRPQRLKYCEGFEVGEYDCDCGCRLTRFNHHAQVLDTVTGRLHEVTPGHNNTDKYIYRSFWADELHAGRIAVEIELYGRVYQQMSFTEQYALLTSHKYDVELYAERECRCLSDYCHQCECGLAKLIAEGKAK